MMHENTKCMKLEVKLYISEYNFDFKPRHYTHEMDFERLLNSPS